jgi:hypothetical protein
MVSNCKIFTYTHTHTKIDLLISRFQSLLELKLNLMKYVKIHGWRETHKSV